MQDREMPHSVAVVGARRMKKISFHVSGAGFCLWPACKSVTNVDVKVGIDWSPVYAPA